MKEFKKNKINQSGIHPEKSDFYKSGRISLNNIEEQSEIKASIPLQVRVNGGPWVDIKALDEQNQA